ncbi:MAG: KH domain-containing protein [Proteobacteria bacterium]|jgi:predicted RNA-binding protein YlqC (UPF0109 family)|nr:KH domain-containing protein [Pseudomonadota bacterium]
MKELVECVAKALVDDPDAVEVGVVKGGPVTVFELHVAEDDFGKVIGKNGRTADAMRTIVSAAAAKHGVKCKLDIVE